MIRRSVDNARAAFGRLVSFGGALASGLGADAPCKEAQERHLPSEGHCDWVQRLYQQWATLPWLTDAERDALDAKLAAAH